MEKPRVERERACERACGTYLEIVRRTLARERVVVCVVHGVVRRRVRGEIGWRLLRFVLSRRQSKSKNENMRRLRVSPPFARNGDGDDDTMMG